MNEKELKSLALDLVRRATMVQRTKKEFRALQSGIRI